MKTNHTLTTGCVAALSLAFTSSLHAGQILGFTWSSGIASIAGEPVDPPVDPNNDNVVGASPNEVVVTQKDFFGVNGVADIVFTVIDSGGTTEYAFIEGVSNSSGIDWNQYRIELGFGEGSGFVASTPGDGLDFDTPDEDSPFDFSVFFPSASLEDEDTILAEGGIFPYLAFTTPPFRFSVDVPDGIDSFTLRQIPIAVPEPASVGLVALGAVAVLNRRRHA
ncbi:MAG: choice-of-anchor F family protein [Phycisphaerales bacterium]